MGYPHGHTHHQSHHRRRDEREEEHPPPPRVEPPFDPYHNQPPPPVVTHVHHSSHGEHSPPPPHHVEPPFDPYRNQPPPPVVTHVHHSSHGAGSPPRSDPSFIPTNHPHHQGPDVPIHKPTVRVYSKAKTNYSLTIRDGKVILAPSNPSDPFQHWIKDEKFSTQVKDEQGFPSFALINKATGQAMKHSIGATHPVQLIHYNPDKLDESILWTFSEDLGDGYRTIRMVNNIRLNVDAFNGDENHGGVHDGTTIVLWEWKKGANQRWKIIPYCLRSPHIQDACMVCRYSSFWEKEGNSGKSSSHPINCSVVFLTVLVKPPALRHSLEIFWSIGDRRSCNFSNAENILPAEFSCSFFNFCLIFF